MKKLIFTLSTVFVISCLTSCKSTLYSGNYGQVNQTQVVLSNANFKVLGTFKGVATEKKIKMTVKNQEGIISKARQNLLENAKAAGVELTGSRTLINVSTDLVENNMKATVTMTAEIIEFTK